MDYIKIIKTLVPGFLKRKLRKIRFLMLCKACYRYDAERYIKYSSAFYKLDSSDKLIGSIVAEYHIIEKGLTMPETRLGFGIEVMKTLIEHCNQYSSQICENDNRQLLHAINVIAEYKILHDKNNYNLDEKLQQSISDILIKYGSQPYSRQISMTRDSYFKHSLSTFENFSNSRHSLRNFSGPVNLSDIKMALKLAQNAPSACNRQPSRVYIVQNKYLKKKILSIQTGNRGFGHLADTLIILTAELGGYLGLRERNDVYVNGGIYAMNLLYALHFYQIGACALNWCSMPDRDLEVRKICEIAPSENIILMIACGGVPDKFELAASPRNDFLNNLRMR